MYTRHHSIIHETASIPDSCKIWYFVQIREGAVLGENVIVGTGAYIGKDVKIGNNVKIENNAFIPHGVTIEDNVFIGPGVIFTNDLYPRATKADGTPLQDGDWKEEKTVVEAFASIGAGTVILSGIVLRKGCMIGAGSVVTKSVPAYEIWAGNPARLRRRLQ